MFASMSAPCSLARRRLMIDAYPIFLTSSIAAGVMAPAHATVDSTLAKFRMPGTSCLTTCALAAVAIRPASVNSASVGISGCMPAPPFEGCSLPLRVSPVRAPATDRRRWSPSDRHEDLGALLTARKRQRERLARRRQPRSVEDDGNFCGLERSRDARECAWRQRRGLEGGDDCERGPHVGRR